LRGPVGFGRGSKMKCCTSFQETSTFFTLDSDHGNAVLLFVFLIALGFWSNKKIFFLCSLAFVAM